MPSRAWAVQPAHRDEACWAGSRSRGCGTLPGNGRRRGSHGSWRRWSPTRRCWPLRGWPGPPPLALVYEADDTNIRAALVARRLNPRLRLVIRLYNRKLGQHLEELLDQAAMVAVPGIDLRELDSSTTVPRTPTPRPPALAASAVAGTSKVVQADGLLLRAVERTPPGRGEVADPGLCTLALLSATTSDPADAEGAESSGDRGPQLLPDDRAVAAATGRDIVALETVAHTDASQARLRPTPWPSRPGQSRTATASLWPGASRRLCSPASRADRSC